MTMIELTTPNGKPVLINIDKIQAIYPHEDGGEIHFSDGEGGWQLVKEDYEEICLMLNKCKAKVYVHVER